MSPSPRAVTRLAGIQRLKLELEGLEGHIKQLVVPDKVSMRHPPLVDPASLQWMRLQRALEAQRFCFVRTAALRLLAVPSRCLHGVASPRPRVGESFRYRSVASIARSVRTFRVVARRVCCAACIMTLGARSSTELSAVC